MGYDTLKTTLIKEKITLLKEYQMDSLWDIMKKIKVENTPGDLVETGTWKGGAAIVIQYANMLFNLKKDLYLYDSFQGTPDITKTKIQNPPYENHPAHTYRVSKKELLDNFDRFDLLLDNVKVYEGWFEDTLPNAEVESVALLRFDGDVYSSTMDVLENLYDKVVPGGYVIIDDYCLRGCRGATDEFREKNNITEPLYTPYNEISKEGDCLCASWWQKKG